MEPSHPVIETASRAPRGARRRLLAAGLGAAVLATAVAVGAPASAATRWLAVSAGATHTCAIKADRTLWCWGENDHGQLGLGHFGNRSAPSQVGSSASWSKVSAGEDHTCAITMAAHRYCWGENGNGELGVGHFVDSATPQTWSGEPGWTSISAGTDHTCGIQTGGVGLCWGRGDLGQLGTGSRLPTSVPDGLGRPWVAISAGGVVTCGLLDVAQDTGTDFRRRYCWGYSGSGGLGLGIVTGRQDHPRAWSVPSNNLLIEHGEWDPRYFDIGMDSGCGIDSSRKLHCWGRNGDYQLGLGDTANRYEPVQLPGTQMWSDVSVGKSHTCAISANFWRWCWGDNDEGQLGLDDRDARRFPTAKIDGPWGYLSTGSYHTCGLRSDNGSLYCWGRNLEGQVGAGTWTTRFLTPQLVN